MALKESSYLPPVKGLATSFTEPSLPESFAAILDNMVLDQSGGMEKRRGLVQIGSNTAGSVTVTDVTELVTKSNEKTLFASTGGSIYKHDTASNTWSAVYTFPTTSADISSIMMSGKLIFYNGVDPNIFTDDGINFQELKALIEVGELASPSSATSVYDGDITSGVGSWILQTDVTPNDLVYNVDLDAYGITNAVVTARVDHTAIGSAATGMGFVDGTQAAGQRYEIIDLVENNIIPTSNINDFDNTAVAGSGTTTTSILVSGVNFANQDIRVGDWVRNTTRAAATQVTSIATAIGVVGIDSQTDGDSLVFLKPAMPLIQDASVHYKRLYAIDARDLRQVRISSPNNPQDFTSDGADLDINNFPINSTSIDKQSFDTGALQPEGDVLVAIRTFQRFLVLLGRSKAYFFEGIEPVGTAANIVPIGLYPQGCVSRFAATNLGNDFVYTTPDGVRAVQLNQDASTFNQTWLSNQLDTTLRNLIKDNSDADTNIQLIYYRRRSWLLCKIGTEIYVYNFAPITLPGKQEAIIGSWTKFTGRLGRQTAFFTRQDGTLVCGGPDGVVSEFDTEVFDDIGEMYKTRLQTGWLNMKEPTVDVRTRAGHYIKPQVVAGGNVGLTVTAEAPYDRESTDEATIAVSGAGSTIGNAVIGNTTIGQSGVVNVKYPLHWRGEVARFLFETNDTAGPFTLSRYTIYWNEVGRR